MGNKENVSCQCPLHIWATLDGPKGTKHMKQRQEDCFDTHLCSTASMVVTLCICGDEFDVARDDLPDDNEHVHCPYCGSYYDADLNFCISKRQTATLQKHRDEWADD